MCAFHSFRRWLRPSIGFAFDDKTLWSVNASDGEVRAESACLALDAKTRKVLAVGNAAETMIADPAATKHVVRVNGFGRGSMVNFDVAEARFRHEMRLCMGGGLRLTPRVLVAATTSDIAKRALADSLTHAGARDVITVPRMMAAALGAGLPVDGERPFIQIVLDSDWVGVAVIVRSGSLVTWENADGLDRIAIARIATKRSADDLRPLRLNEEMERLRRDGLDPDDPELRSFFLHLRERLWSEAAGLDAEKVRAIQAAPVWLAGSCAAVPGVAVGASLAWGQPVVPVVEPERCVILGVRKLLGELDWVLRRTHDR